MSMDRRMCELAETACGTAPEYSLSEYIYYVGHHSANILPNDSGQI